MRVHLVDFGTTRHEYNEPLGLEMLAGTLESAFNEKIDISFQSFSMESARNDEIGKFNLIGISTRIGTANILDKFLYDHAVAEWPDFPLIVLGGTTATFATEHILRKYPNVICVVGEGETAIKEIVDVLLSSKIRGVKCIDDLKRVMLRLDIKNLSFLLDEKIENTTRIYENLNALPLPSRRVLPKVLSVGGIARAEASRGCPFGRCKFCAVSDKYNKYPYWRPFPLEWVIEDIINISNIGATNIYFSDEDFLGDSLDRVEYLANRIFEAKNDKIINPHIQFYMNTRANSILGDKLGGKERSIQVLKLLRSVGFREVFVGIESGARKQLYRYGKGVSINKNLRALEILDEIGFSTDIGFIMFDRDTTIGQLQENIEFIKKANLSRHASNLIKAMRIQAGTIMEKEFIENAVMASKLLNLNDLQYPYSFSDDRVSIIYHNYLKWEALHKDDLYHIQAVSRGEIPSDNFRVELKKELGKIRELDLKFLESSIEYLDKGITKYDELEYALQYILVEKKRIIEGIISTL